MSDAPDEVEVFTAPDVEFVYEHKVGLSVYAYKPTPWLSWEETQALAKWLADLVGAP